MHRNPHSFRLLALAACLMIAVVPVQAGAGERARFTWQVIGIKDGDTLSVTLPGLPDPLNPVAVRLRGADAPESGGRAKCASERRLAERATHFTRQAIASARRVEFEEPAWDK